MSHFLDPLAYSTREREPLPGGHGVTTHEDRQLEDVYPQCCQHDTILCSTHGTNCTCTSS